MPVDLIVRGGRVYTPRGLVDASVAVDEGKVVALGVESALPQGDKILEATGKLVLPGLIDTHAHFRDPGFTHKEDYTTGTQAAAAGGVTLAVDMPNVQPPPNTLERFRAHNENAQKKAVVDFGHNAAGTVQEEIPKLAQAGTFGFKIFQMTDVGRDYPHMPGIGIDDDGVLLDLFREIAKTGRVAILHPWNQPIWERVTKMYWSQGKTDFRAYAKAVREYDSIIFTSAIGTLCQLQRVTGVKLHILHMSAQRSFDIVQQAKAEGGTVTTEVNPHDVFLANKWENIERLGPYSIGWQVPEHEGEATWRALVDGRADLIGTDHAPHTKAEKEVGWKEMWKAPGGTPAIEWYLKLFLTQVNNGRLSIERLVQLSSENPAKIFGVYPRKGAIQPGSDADLVIVDMKKAETLSDTKMYTRCGWNPYAGQQIRGAPVTTLVRGTVVMQDGEVIGKPGYGQFVHP